MKSSFGIMAVVFGTVLFLMMLTLFWGVTLSSQLKATLVPIESPTITPEQYPGAAIDRCRADCASMQSSCGTYIDWLADKCADDWGWTDKECDDWYDYLSDKCDEAYDSCWVGCLDSA